MQILDKTIAFPHPSTTHSSGVLAIGGDLSIPRLLLAYQYGIFPWYNEEDPILWWHPDPRFVIFPDQIKVSKSMRPYFNQEKYKVTFDTCFHDVIKECGTSKDRKKEGTWISEEIEIAYGELHRQGIAHSVEVWEDDELVGGLYGLSIGKIFSGESMFSKAKNTSKVALITLSRILEKEGYFLIDCQIENPHLKSMGGVNIPRSEFLEYIKKNRLIEIQNEKWTALSKSLDLKNIL